ncbi:MAG: phosphoglucosamine mutase [Candidatus Saccharicenans sp.]|jgi:phosphoglucosamine mutase|nr:phosphoglucosamine mutase [Candidatus Saccharicenans sp.]MDH7492427.1 phosphoglucosamine mutase [Candidatus Saccharicenans sp.]
MPQLFGTDGLRARAGEFPLDEKSVFILGRALAELLIRRGLQPRMVSGRDTRQSGRWLEECLTAGFARGGGQAISAGVITTPGISYLVRSHDFSAGVVISASHNPYLDNGIKIFSHRGTKIAESWEEELEKEIISGILPPAGVRESDLRVDDQLKQAYLDFLRQVYSGPRNKKIKLVVDCANGASSELAPRLFSSLGFEVVTINSQPDGQNINLGCGSLHPERLAEMVRSEKADLGVAFDGDADRAIWSDEKGRILNGDHTLYVQARHLKDKKSLKNNTVVATIMSNMGLEKGLEENGIRLLRTKVGDKYVLDEMLKSDYNLGGEQSGHTIFLDHSVAGDGLLTSLKMLEVMLEKEMTLSELVKDFREFPQILLNVRVREKVPLAEIPGYQEAIAEVKDRLGRSGRVEVRYSGTEMLARIMLEGPEQKQIEDLAGKLARLIEEHCGLK